MTRFLVDPDPDREAARQARLLDVAERRFARQFASVISIAMAQMNRRYAQTGSIPPLPDDHEFKVRAVFFDLSSAMATSFGGRILGQEKCAGVLLEHKAGWGEFFQRLAIEWITNELIRRRIVSIAETTRRNVIAAIVRGQSEGLGIEAIAKGISDSIPTISRQRGRVIARTETHGAANNASLQSAKATGLELQKRWVSVEDGRTRDFGVSDGIIDEFDHRSMYGQPVGMDQPFLMPWKFGDPIPCQRPGDETLPPGAVINCRCAMTYVLPD